ncbi:unnamed protein product [Brassicogethes aeneus]|uniref:Glucosylceramidase n=1 Tax=Brassicogethes aeneus TaxID=1431903 RepID=A0A9P0ANP3_BRAAE|nr:unnamed protein product [Brassicogethes aeneus]
MVLLTYIFFILLFTYCKGYHECNQKKTDYGYVCVCDSSKCDTVPEIDVSTGKFQMFSTSSNKMGFTASSGTLKPSSNTNFGYKIDLQNSSVKQKVIGFGGAFTDSSGINIKSLPEGAQKNLLNSYFGSSGVQYSLGRVPMGGTDFSIRQYTYDDHDGDLELKYFSLQNEDHVYKIPLIKKAYKLSNNSLNLFASSWTAPPWMKNTDMYASGILKDEYYQTWADYYIKFFQEYKKSGVNFWGLTTQNEPVDGFVPSLVFPLNSLGFTTAQMKKWVSENLGPTIRKSEFKDLKIIAHDDQRTFLQIFSSVWEDDDSGKYIDGVGVHWYWDAFAPNSVLELAKSSKKDLFLLGTEACNGAPVKLGSWERGQSYIKSIISDFEYGAGGWMDFNLVLNQEGGPHVILNPLDSPIIVNNSTGEFYKQPMYYAMGHFSKFLRPDSVVLEVQNNLTANLKSVAALRPDGLTAVIVYNEGSESAKVEVISKGGSVLQTSVPAKSINTILF